jgi:hypothetical protein
MRWTAPALLPIGGGRSRHATRRAAQSSRDVPRMILESFAAVRPTPARRALVGQRFPESARGTPLLGVSLRSLVVRARLDRDIAVRTSHDRQQGVARGSSVRVRPLTGVRGVGRACAPTFRHVLPRLIGCFPCAGAEKGRGCGFGLAAPGRLGPGVEFQGVRGVGGRGAGGRGRIRHDRSMGAGGSSHVQRVQQTRTDGMDKEHVTGQIVGRHGGRWVRLLHDCQRPPA